MLGCATWPRLVLVVYASASELTSSHFSAEWQYMLGVMLRADRSKSSWTQTAVMVRSHSAASQSMFDLTTQHCMALANFANKYRHNTRSMCLQGPLLGCRAVQTIVQGCWPVLECLEVCKAPQLEIETISHLCELHSVTDVSIADCRLDAAALTQLGTGWPHLESISLNNNQIDATTILALPRDKWPELFILELSFNTVGAAGMRHLASCSWPEMLSLNLHFTDTAERDLQWLLQAPWPALRILNLTGNKITAVGVSHLLRGKWEYLRWIFLSAECLDLGACLLLGITREELTSRITCPQHAADPTKPSELCTYKPSLPQFPCLDIGIANNVASRHTEMIVGYHQLLGINLAND